MAINDNKTAIKSIRQRNYLARDFDSFRTVLLDYARQYYPDKIQDFSEASVGGLFLDMAAYVGDNLSFYLDHLYGELNSETVVETKNIEKILRSSGVPITGAAAALVNVDFYVEVPVLSSDDISPDPDFLPTILEGTIIQAANGTQFTLLDNVKFWSVNKETGTLILNPSIVPANGRRIGEKIVSKILRNTGLCTSGNINTEAFSIGEFIQFRRLTLSRENITQVLSVSDSLGNIYYEVGSLTHDVVYKNVLNVIDNSMSNSLVKDNLKVIPAPYRFVKEVSLNTRQTTLIFGGGTADNFEDDLIPDPSEFALPLPFSQTFSRIPINPQKMLQTATLGVASANTVLTVTYRYGGGLSHNVNVNTIRDIIDLRLTFPSNASEIEQSQVRRTIEASNPQSASGGEDALAANELLALVPTIKNSQERIVTKEDLLTRVYTMPSNFGRVFRASIVKNPSNPLASILYVISRNAQNQLIISPDALKINLRRYLSSYRMVSDSLDIMDASVVNLELFFEIVADPSLNKSILLQSIIASLKSQLKLTNFHIGQPIVISDIISTIFSKPGVISVSNIKFNSLYGTVKNKDYSPIAFNVAANLRNQIIYPPAGSIFEIKYPDINIIGKCVS